MPALTTPNELLRAGMDCGETYLKKLHSFHRDRLAPSDTERLRNGGIIRVGVAPNGDEIWNMDPQLFFRLTVYEDVTELLLWATTNRMKR